MSHTRRKPLVVEVDRQRAQRRDPARDDGPEKRASERPHTASCANMAGEAALSPTS